MYYMTLTLFARLYIHLLILPLLTLSRGHDIYCIHYLVLTFSIPTCDHVTLSHTLFLHLHWLIKSIKSGLLGETSSKRSGRCAWKGGSSEGLVKCDFMIFWLCDSVIMWFSDYERTIFISNLSTLNCFSILFRSTKHITCLICSCPVGWGTWWLYSIGLIKCWT